MFWRTWVVVLAPFVLSPIILCAGEEQSTVEAMKCAYLILLMALYWMTEALPLPITSMIPMVQKLNYKNSFYVANIFRLDCLCWG